MSNDAMTRDIGLMVDGGGNMLAPTINKSDFEYREAQGDPTIQINTGGGDSGENWVTQANPNYRPAGYYLTDAARARLGDQWTKNDTTSIGWGEGFDAGGMLGGGRLGQNFESFFGGGVNGLPNMNLTQRGKYGPDGEFLGNETGYWEGGGDNPTWKAWDPYDPATTRQLADEAFNRVWSGDGINAMVKTADKAATGVRWVRQGDSFVPAGTTGTTKVNTNNNHTIPAAAFASLLAVGLAAGAAAAGAGAGAGGGAGAGAGAGVGAGASSSTLSSMLAGGLAPTGTSVTLGGSTTVLGAAGSAGVGGVTAGALGGGALVPASLSGSLGPAFAAGLGGAGSITPTAATLAGWNAAAPTITGVANSSPGLIQQALNAYNSPTGKAIRSGVQLAKNLMPGGAPTEAGGMPDPAAGPAPSGNPANLQVGNIDFSKIGSAVGTNKPGQVPVPEYDPYKIKPSTNGTVGSTFNFKA